RSLGTVVIGGLTSSLLLTLVIVPIMFVWIAPGPVKKDRREETGGLFQNRPALAPELR
ncbi:MAG: hypothetical protein IAI50_13025, partial [Candidatus Eremiobacteraeota bacterium]|nr:hypothetical protein [Candidatus Eremiobacteraeota bacterium]